MTLPSEEHIFQYPGQGRIEVICGSMFSGKTEELIRRLKRAKFAKQRVEIFKPAIDTRYSQDNVVSHDSNSIPSTPGGFFLQYPIVHFRDRCGGDRRGPVFR